MSTPWPEIATALAVFGANVLSPGPNVFNTIAIALGSGRRAALMVVPAVALCGHCSCVRPASGDSGCLPETPLPVSQFSPDGMARNVKSFGINWGLNWGRSLVYQIHKLEAARDLMGWKR